MRVEVVLLPSMLQKGQLGGRSVAVFDVLRATTTMAAALAAEAREIRLFADLASAKSAADAFDGPRTLVGEVECLPPEGFDLGNSPGAFDRRLHDGRTLFMCTTNGTRALLAAAEGEEVLPAALVNRSAVARALAGGGRDLTLLCAGTNGQPALEDLLGAGSVIDRLTLEGDVTFDSDVARLALAAWHGCTHDLLQVLRETQGGRNIIAAGLDEDIEFAERVDGFDVVGRLIPGETPTVRRV